MSLIGMQDPRDADREVDIDVDSSLQRLAMFKSYRTLEEASCWAPGGGGTFQIVGVRPSARD